ncbi:MAG TPA: VOC family protein [Abditibacteriaceae bacterium]|jgi:catechol 2,3-dioxygenase-like lactoylglutathione lyase family enzyme
MFEMDHVALQTDDVAASVLWYTQNFGAEILYQDATWAFLKLGQGKLALVSPAQHPPHLALRVGEDELAAAAARAGKPIDRHRDGTTGIYIDDPQGNVLELICYPPGETVYETRRETRTETG